MSDLIKRADAIEAVENNSYGMGSRASVKAIKALPSADAVSREEYERLEALYDAIRIYDASAEAVQGWIPCSERLPDIKEHHVSEACLVYCENGAYGFAELEENIFGQVGWDCEREDEYHEPLGEVIAWMPLPEPYKGGEK